MRRGVASKQKKPTWRNTRRFSTTSAYLLMSLPDKPGCSSNSHPNTSLPSRFAARGSLTRAAMRTFYHCYGRPFSADHNPPSRPKHLRQDGNHVEGSAQPVLLFAILPAASAKSVGTVFQQLRWFERWARRLTGAPSNRPLIDPFPRVPHKLIFFGFCQPGKAG